MERIERLTQLNVELEGLLHVLAKRDNSHIRGLLRTKYAEYATAINELLQYFDANPLDESMEKVEAVDKVLSHDEVKDQEAVSSEVEDEDEVASAAIERGETLSEEDNAEEIVEVELGELPEYKPEAQPGEEPSATAVSVEHEAPETEQPEEIAETAEKAEPTEHSLFDEEPVREPIGQAPVSAKNDMRVEELISQKNAVDLKRAFTLNDKFRFRKSLFNHDDAAFTEALERIAEQPTFEAACEFVKKNFRWDLSDPDVEYFMSVIEPHFS